MEGWKEYLALLVEYPRSTFTHKWRINMKDNKECCYEEMTNKVGGQSQPQEYWHEPMQNVYETGRKGWNADGYNQSGMKGK